jgi:hypothetical protein
LSKAVPVVTAGASHASSVPISTAIARPISPSRHGQQRKGYPGPEEKGNIGRKSSLPFILHP